MAKHNEPSAESLDEMPEVDDERFRRLPGRGHHVSRSLEEIVAIEPELPFRGWRGRQSPGKSKTPA
jgi:hypothetical protein